MVTTSVPHGNAWRQSAVHAGRRSDERVLFTMRQSAIAPLVTMWPVLAGIALTLALNGLSLWLTGFVLPIPFQVGLFVLLLILSARWLIHDGLNWYACSYTLTNTRLIVGWGVLSRRRRQAPLAQIQNVRVIWPNPIANWLNVGDVGVRTGGASGDLLLSVVRQPEAVARAIMEAQRASTSTTREGILTRRGVRDGRNTADADGLNAAAKAVLQVMDSMGAPTEENPDAEDREESQGGDGAGTSGVLRRALVTLLPGERLVAQLHRHWFALLRKLALPLAFGALLIIAGSLLSPLPALSSMNASWVMIGAGALLGLIWGGLVTLNYMDDVFILTTRRIIDIDRRFAVLAEARREAFYTAVQDVVVSSPPLGRIFGYGRIRVETAGQAPNIEMDNIAYPLETQDRIFALIRSEKQRNATKERQNHRRDVRAEVALALNALLVPMPDVRNLPIGEAITLMRRAGLSVSVAPRRSSVAGTHGRVIGQAPRPGAILVRGGEAQLAVSMLNAAAPPLLSPSAQGANAVPPGATAAFRV